MEELVANIHIHSNYSDGSASHDRIAEAALEASLDVIIITDHNILPQAKEKYFVKDNQRLLLLVGEEIHDQTRQTPINHLLVFGAQKELSVYAGNVQNLINQAKRHGGLTFLAHPHQKSLQIAGEPGIPWEDWDIQGFHGLEVWNHLNELRARSKNWLSLVINGFFPQLMTQGPDLETIQKWDILLASKKKIYAIGGSDAHAIRIKKGIFRKTIFPYKYHFSAINTHLLIQNNLTGELITDRKLIINAIKQGNMFIGYDLPAPTRGFRFSAQGTHQEVTMGEDIYLDPGVTMQIKLPFRTKCSLIKDGQVIKQWQNLEICTYITNEPGAYRVESTIHYLGKERTWIISNPIFVRRKA